MIYQIKEVVKDVKVCIDQNKDSAPLLLQEDIDTLSLNEIIESKVEGAVRSVHMAAQPEMLDGGKSFGDSVRWGSLESGWTLLPGDFMRLLVFEMSDWERPVYEAIGATSTGYTQQRSRYKGLRGTPQRPVCAIVRRPEGLALEFYSCKSESAQVAKAQYLPWPKVDEDGGIEVCERCYQAVVYAAAALTLTALGDSEKAGQFFELSKTAMNGIW